MAENADIVIGIKVRMSENVIARHGLEPLKRAVQACEKAGTGAKVMCHIGGVETPALMSEILNTLRAGDVLTHCYSGAPNVGGQFTNIVQGGKLLTAALAAKQRGVVFDIGHGGGSFDYTVAEAAIQQGCPPDVISSDIHVFSGNTPGMPYLTWVMSKFLNMGFTPSPGGRDGHRQPGAGHQPRPEARHPPDGGAGRRHRAGGRRGAGGVRRHAPQQARRQGSPASPRTPWPPAWRSAGPTRRPSRALIVPPRGGLADVASRGYIVDMTRTTNIRALKDRLSAFLRDVQRGDVILITDRGRVVAELRSPTVGQGARDAVEPRARRLVEEGTLKLGLPNAPGAYHGPGISLPDDVVDRALSWTRGDR